MLKYGFLESLQLIQDESVANGVVDGHWIGLTPYASVLCVYAALAVSTVYEPSSFIFGFEKFVKYTGVRHWFESL